MKKGLTKLLKRSMIRQTDRQTDRQTGRQTGNFCAFDLVATNIYNLIDTIKASQRITAPILRYPTRCYFIFMERADDG